MSDGLEFKIASEKGEFDQVHALNYETFAEEIPQHDKNDEGSLVDKFNEENTYIICLDSGELVGMLAVRDRRPFSLDGKIPDLDSHLPPFRSACEIRLLAIKKDRRNRKVVLGLFTSLAAWCEEGGYDIALISANVEREKLYKNLGFTPFGPRVGKEGAFYQPMYLTPEPYYRMKAGTRLLSRMRGAEGEGGKAPLNFLPGPVDATPAVRKAMGAKVLSHRSDDFVAAFEDVRRRLSALVNASRTSILMGSGTLANDAVAANLTLAEGRGLVLSNGEFGERLVDHARRFGLAFETLAKGWGETFSRAEIESALDASPGTRWLWAVHSETSTGVLNDLGMLKGVCAARGVKLCLDCISSLGTVALDLSDVYMATGTSGKGLRSFAGLSFVFRGDGAALPPGNLPRYLDLSLYEGSEGPPFTVSSNLLYALREALAGGDGWEARYAAIRKLSAAVRLRLREAGLGVVAPEGHDAPALVTIALPGEVPSGELGPELEKSGYFLNWRSTYLVRRNWVQIALMGEYDSGAVGRFLDFLASAARPRKRA
ncbi:MAG TPA: aminotransferase class V-fold PLP-dependent enzyme [Thermodesulfobacteriota bacterium]|nr:aminotransferase class V-fold PLP-dependent enzyme [Thermodesulfobacteriota bacterium]